MSLEELLKVRVVSAAKREQDIADVAASVVVLTRDDIALSGATEFIDVLRWAVGVDVARSPGDLPQYKAGIRGSASSFLNERVLVMVDGIPMYHPTGGGIDLGLLAVSFIDKVEIIKGPVSALYGANAFSGIINIITRSHQGGHKVTSGARLGAKFLKNIDDGGIVAVPFGNAYASGKLGKADFFLSLDAVSNRAGYMDIVKKDEERTQGYENIDVFSKVGFQVNDRLKLTASAMVSRDHRDVGYANAPDPMMNEAYQVALVAEAEPLSYYSLKVRGYFDEFINEVIYDDDLERYQTHAHVFGAEVQNTLLLPGNILIAGVDFRRDASELYTKYQDWNAGFPPPIEIAGWDQQTSLGIGMYVQNQYTGVKGLTPTAGLRFDHNSLYGSNLSPRVGVAYRVRDGLVPYATVARSFRAPNFNETFIEGFGRLGNPNLAPESLLMYEVGVKGTLYAKKTQFNLAAFRHDVENTIITAYNPDSGLQEFRNSDETAIHYGLEVELSQAIVTGFSVFGNVALHRGPDGEEAEQVAAVKAMGGLVLQRGALSVRGQATYRSEKWFSNTNPSLVDENGNILERVTLDDVLTLDLYAAKTFKLDSYSLRLSLFGENLTGLDYNESYGSFLLPESQRMPGRRFGVAVGGTLN